MHVRRILVACSFFALHVPAVGLAGLDGVQLYTSCTDEGIEVVLDEYADPKLLETYAYAIVSRQTLNTCDGQFHAVSPPLAPEPIGDGGARVSFLDTTIDRELAYRYGVGTYDADGRPIDWSNSFFIDIHDFVSCAPLLLGVGEIVVESDLATIVDPCDGCRQGVGARNIGLRCPQALELRTGDVVEFYGTSYFELDITVSIAYDCRITACTVATHSMSWSTLKGAFD